MGATPKLSMPMKELEFTEIDRASNENRQYDDSEPLSNCGATALGSDRDRFCA